MQVSVIRKRYLSERGQQTPTHPQIMCPPGCRQENDFDMCKVCAVFPFNMCAVRVICNSSMYLHYELHYRYQSNVAKNCLDTILSIQPKDSSSGGGETRESYVYRLADDMLEKLPANYVNHEVRKSISSVILQSKSKARFMME